MSSPHCPFCYVPELECKYLASVLLLIPVPDGDSMKTHGTFSTFYVVEGIVSQYWQCAYRITWRRVRVTVVAVQKQDVISYSECPSVCSHSYPASETHAPYDTAICGLYSCTVFLYIIS